MPDPQGLASFPGVQQILSAEYTLSHGITPGVCTLTMAPQASFEAEGGTLVFSYGGAAVVTLRDCKVDTHGFSADGSGQRWTLSILDRRWKWAWGTISGSWNTRDADGNIEEGREKTPAELAGLCLTAMGETRFDTAQLPSGPRPPVEWDHDNPAQALSEIADLCGCRVVLRLDDTVLIARAGQGADLTFDETGLNDSLTINPPEKPQALLLVGGKTRYQCDFRLRAVGRDTDGEIKPIDELSYRPAAGWTGVTPPFFDDVADEEAQALARATVYRWYRVYNTRGSPDGVLDVPGYGQLDHGSQMLPLEGVQVETYADELQPKWPTGTKPETPLPAEVFGRFYDGKLTFANTAADGVYEEGFRVNGEQAIVEFAGYVWKLGEDADLGKALPAELYLRTAFSIRDPQTLAYGRYERPRQIGTVTTPPRVVKREDVVRTVYATYSEADDFDRLVGTPTSVIDNFDDLQAEADYYLDAAQAEYQTPTPREITWGVLKPISPDGAIHQVTWSVGASGATTRASRNSEFSLVVPTWKERRKAERLRGDTLAQMQAQMQQQRAQLQRQQRNPFAI